MTGVTADMGSRLFTPRVWGMEQGAASRSLPPVFRGGGTMGVLLSPGGMATTWSSGKDPLDSLVPLREEGVDGPLLGPWMGPPYRLPFGIRLMRCLARYMRGCLC